jgi:hypothetical protein
MRFSTPTPLLSRTCLALFVVAGAWAQQTQPAKPPQKRDDPLTRSSFSAKGLHHEDYLTDFFVGNFADVPFDRGSMSFAVLINQYMEAYARHCDAYLPANKVELTRQACVAFPPPPRPGDPPPLPGTSSSCLAWRTVSLGYADPALYAAKAQLDDEQAANQAKDLLGSLLGSKNLISSGKDAFQLAGDMDALFGLNACDSAGLRRFQENVVLFSKGKQPILLPGALPPVQSPPDRAAQAKAQAEASVRGSVCVPDDLLAEWRNPPPGGKMEALQRTLKASLRERATLSHFDQTKWMTVDSRIYSTWNPAGPFRGVVTATDGGSCAVGHHEFLALIP